MIGSANNFTEKEGECLCGAVRFWAVPKSFKGGARRRLMCRQRSGGVFMSVEVFPDWKKTGEISSGVYESSMWAQRRFCPKCGASISGQLSDGLNTMLSAPTFDDDGSFVLSTEIFVDKKPEFYEFSDDTKKFTEADVLAHFSEKRS